MKREEPPEPELPAWRAFVVQLSKRSDGPSGALKGRLEHLSSGRRTRFECAEDLIRGLRRILEEIDG